MQNILSKYSILYLTNHTNRSAHKDYFSNPKGVTWEAVLNVQDWSTVGGGGTLGQQGEIQIFLAEAYRCAFETETAKSAGRVRPGSQVNMLFKSL